MAQGAEAEMSDQLVHTIKVLIEKGDKASEKAEQFYIAAGQHLKTLKGDKPEGITWEQFLEDAGLKISRSRADKLIQIADGRTTVEEVKEKNKVANSKLRSLSRDSEEEGDSLPASISFSPSTSAEPEDFWDSEKEGHQFPPPARRQGLLNRAAEAVRLAKFDHFDGLTVDEEMRKAVREAVNAWTETLAKMEATCEETKAA